MPPSSPSHDELDLLHRVAAKDRRAFEALYHLYYRRLFGYLLKLTRRAELVEEVLNDVMFAIWKGAASFDGRSRPSTWIFGIAYHKALKALARRPQEQRRTRESAGADGPRGARAPGGAAGARGGAGTGDRRPLRRAAGGGRADLLLRARLSGDRGDRGLPGQHGEDADVPCPPAPAASCCRSWASREPRARTPADRKRGSNDERKSHREGHGERAHRQVGELLPWYVNGTLGERERREGRGPSRRLPGLPGGGARLPADGRGGRAPPPRCPRRPTRPSSGASSTASRPRSSGRRRPAGAPCARSSAPPRARSAWRSSRRPP